MRRLVAAVLLVAGLAVPAAHGHGDPDQLHDPPSPYFQNWWCSDPPGPSQSFSPSRRLLAAVDVRVRAGAGWPKGGPNPDLVITVHRDRVDSPVVGSARVNAGEVPAHGTITKLVHVDFSAPVVLEPAGTYVIEFNPMNPMYASWIGATVNSYSGGMMFTCGGAAVPAYDFNFNTYTPADAVPPETRLTGGVRAGSFTNRTTAIVSFEGTDDLSYSTRLRYLCSLDGGAATSCSSPVTYVGLASGAHALAVQAVDESGKADPTPDSVSWTVRLDFDPPETTIAGSVAHGAQSNSRNASFALTASEADVAFECTVDGGVWRPCDPRVELSDLADGVHRLEARSIDVVGNVDPSAATVEWVVDTSAPRRARIVAVGRQGSRLVFKLAAEDPPRRGPVRFVCAVDGGALARCSTPWRIQLRPGRHRLRAAAEDLAGNRGPVGTLAVVVR